MVCFVFHIKTCDVMGFYLIYIFFTKVFSFTFYLLYKDLSLYKTGIELKA